MKQLLLPVIICLVVCKTSLHAQSFFSSRNAYLGQPLPGDVPQRFSPLHLTDSGYFILGRVAFSPDGKEFYYGANNQWYSNDNQILNYYRFENGSWKGPFLLNKQI